MKRSCYTSAWSSLWLGVAGLMTGDPIFTWAGIAVSISDIWHAQMI